MDWIGFLCRHRILQFLFTGGSGALLNLGVTALLTETILGRERYFGAYLMGLGVNIIYNFALHTRLTFRTRQGHGRRFGFFLGYNLAMTALQAGVVKVLVGLVGVDYYLPVIAGVILTFATITYVVYRWWVFRET